MSLFLKRPPKFLYKKIPNCISPRCCSSERKNRDTPQTLERRVRQMKRLSAIGVAAALLTSYVVVKKTFFRKSNDDMLVSVSDMTSNQKPQTLVEKVEQTTPAIEFSEELVKENSMREKYNFIKRVVNDCAQAVFYLELRDPYKRDLETGEPIVTSNGSGFIISEDGWALTNAHVVLNKPQSTISAIMRDGKTYRARVEDADMNIDLALLKLETDEKLPTLQFSEIGDTSVGEWVVALGSPLSLSNSVTVGIVSCVDRPAEELGLKNYSMTYIQTDASITFGNSGGPLVNLDGNVIGVNNLRLTSGISFAIPIEYVKRFLENGKYRIKKDRKNTGLAGKTMLGITTISITSDLMQDLLKENKNIPKSVAQGLLVWKIIPGSPAYICGMEVGDIITHVNGVPIQKSSELYELTADTDTVEIKLIHRGKETKAKLTTKKT